MTASALDAWVGGPELCLRVAALGHVKLAIANRDAIRTAAVGVRNVAYTTRKCVRSESGNQKHAKI